MRQEPRDIALGNQFRDQMRQEMGDIVLGNQSRNQETKFTFTYKEKFVYLCPIIFTY
jgi:hypothetical protein